MLKVENLSKAYGGVNALENLSFELNAGTVLGLVGDNGAGKSTLAKCLSGALKADKGTVRLAERNLALGSPKAAQQAGIEMVYQNLALCPQRNAVENIFLGRELTRYALLDEIAMRQQAEELLTSLGADVALNTPVQNLSGGQQQAVALARALLSKPKLIILDEPTSALAEKETQKVIKLINNLKAQSVSVILISHRLSDIFATADRLLLLQHGALLQDVAAHDISQKEVTEFLLS